MNKQILRLAIPNVISNITVPLLGMADLAILGHLESELYIGAIALGGMIFNFIYALFSFLRMGTSGFTAQSYGEDNKQELIMMFGRAMFFALAGGLLIILMQYPIDQLSFWLLEGSEERAVSFVKLPAALAIDSGRGAAISLRLNDCYTVEIASDFEAETLGRLLDVLENRGCR